MFRQTFIFTQILAVMLMFLFFACPLDGPDPEADPGNSGNNEEPTGGGDGDGDGDGEETSTPEYVITDENWPIAGQSGVDFAGEFTIDNTSQSPGTNQIEWVVYLSADETLDEGDTEVAAGSIAPLDAASISGDIEFEGTWPAAGDWYLIISISSDSEESDEGNTSVSDVLAVSEPSPPDYIIVNEDYFAAGTYAYNDPYAVSFQIRNDGAGPGSQTVSYGVYFIQTISIGDINWDTTPPQSSGTIEPLAAGETSAVIDTAGVMDFTGTYRVYIRITAEDDEDSSNNEVYNVQSYNVYF